MRQPFRIEGGLLTVPDRPGRGVELDMAQVEAAKGYIEASGSARATKLAPCNT